METKNKNKVKTKVQYKVGDVVELVKSEINQTMIGSQGIVTEIEENIVYYEGIYQRLFIIFPLDEVFDRSTYLAGSFKVKLICRMHAFNLKN